MYKIEGTKDLLLLALLIGKTYPVGNLWLLSVHQSVNNFLLVCAYLPGAESLETSLFPWETSCVSLKMVPVC